MKKAAIKSLVFGLVLIASAPSPLYAHRSDPSDQMLDWHTDQIAEVIGGRAVSLEGKACIKGSVFRFDVRDEYAFDIDETVWLDIEFQAEAIGSGWAVLYERNDKGLPGISLLIDARHRDLPLIPLHRSGNSGWYKASIALERARFANRGALGPEDFAIFGLTNADTAQGKLTICKMTLRRELTTPVANAFGWTSIEVLDERGEPTSARVGIYNAHGRQPLPGTDAVALRTLGTTANRVIGLGYGVPTWPSRNRSVFYIDGRYRSRLPVGEYRLIVSKGPEYRTTQERFSLAANQHKPIQVKLRRWIDMAARGWYSGEGHIHYARHDRNDDRDLGVLAQAEDLKVANILQMGNSADTVFPQYSWKPTPSRNNHSLFFLAPGQEDPRTTRLGHTIQLNLNAPVRDPAHYLLYHKTFEKVRSQGGLTGYAHVVEPPGWDSRIADVRGLAIDVPFGLVDFVEVLSYHFIGTATWFDFLNLGYKLTPTAGSDYPYAVIPGAVRNYVKVDGPFTPQAWFDALKRGRTFVTSGPMLELSINGQGMGSEIHARSGEPLLIQAKASVNPDIDALSSLELIEQGDTIKVIASQQGAKELALRHKLRVEHGSWFVVRARGKDPNVIAMSAPIYVLMDDQSFWKPAAVEAIATKMKSRMQDIFREGQLETTDGAEVFAQHWDAQKSALKTRVDRAVALYDDLIKRAAARSSEIEGVAKPAELERVLDRLFAPPQIRAEPGFAARVLVPPGHIYDPIWLRSRGKQMWVSDDGGMDAKGHQGSIWAIDEHGKFSPLVALGRFSMGPPLGLDVAPTSFGSYEGQIFTISQAEPLRKGIYDRAHLVQRIDPTMQNNAETFCTLPMGGFPDGRGLPAGGNDASFGPDGSPFAGKFFVATFMNATVYQVTADGRCTPFVTFDPGKWGSPIGLTFTPDGQHLLVSMYVGVEGAPSFFGKTLPGQATIARVRPDGAIEPQQLVRVSPKQKLSIWQMAYAPAGFGNYAGQLFMTAKLSAGQQVLGHTPPETGAVYRLTAEGELKLVATGFRTSTGLAFSGNRLWVSDVNGDHRELPDGFVAEITATR